MTEPRFATGSPRYFRPVCIRRPWWFFGGSGDRRRHMNDDAWSDALSTIENAGEESYGQRAG